MDNKVSKTSAPAATPEKKVSQNSVSEKEFGLLHNPKNRRAEKNRHVAASPHCFFIAH
jgi:hypothetical protein